MILSVVSVALQARQTSKAGAVLIGKQSYQVNINAGYDHVFLLCLVVVMNACYHQDISTGVAIASS